MANKKVILHATLIDGNGGTPVEDSCIVIDGEQIAAVGKFGQVEYPQDAEIIDATGKYIIPGLGDAGDRLFGTK